MGKKARGTASAEISVNPVHKDAHAHQARWAIFFWPLIPKNLKVLEIWACHGYKSERTGIRLEAAIVGASHYLMVWLGRFPLVMVILACGPSVDLLDAKPAGSADYQKLLWLSRKRSHRYLQYQRGRVFYRGRIIFKPFAETYVHPSHRSIWFAYGFGGRGEINRRKDAQKRLRHDPLTVVSVNHEIKDGCYVIRIRTEHEYPNKRKRLDKIIYTEEVVKIWLGRISNLPWAVNGVKKVGKPRKSKKPARKITALAA